MERGHRPAFWAAFIAALSEVRDHDVLRNENEDEWQPATRAGANLLAAACTRPLMTKAPPLRGASGPGAGSRATIN